MARNPVDHTSIITIERHILEEQSFHPEATGTLTNILYDLALAGKVIASKTTRAGLAEILGRTEDINIQGETVMKLDRFADLTISRLTDHTGRLAGLASEENDDFIPIPDKYPLGKYLLVFDPLDGSSNVDYNMPIGTIFGIYKRTGEDGPVSVSEFLQPGRKLVASGYIAYGTSTMFVYTAGHGVHGFTLDPAVGEFLLSHPDIKIPPAKYFSVNLGYQLYWSLGVQAYTEYLQGRGGGIKGLSLRYIGTLVSDFHRNLLAGGVFYYPADSKDPQLPTGKLRLLYEAAPLAFIAEQAGGAASDGHGPILDVKPTSLHQRTPLFIGNRELIEKVEELIRGMD
ncbi:MAG: class 1 fructose-bisphosphatase [Candidatus Aminicenantes bacterium]|nr:class 1 fructose-bisphosphatase [Candidatus Aminicenantes bacterium]